ncbi:MAG TPA: hypothetical protein VK619_00305 [Pyrinomonadaceae bacterium]|nr:hypothetical protein [Pyrinomonadaceae bacterium]
MKNRIRFLFCCLLCFMLASTALAQRRQRHRPTAWGAPEVFSDMYLDAETGDVGGTEIILSQSYGGTWATVMIGSGIAYDPVLVEVKSNGSYIEFTLPSTPPYDGYGKFTGKISRAGLTLWNNGQRYGFLPRQCR